MTFQYPAFCLFLAAVLPHVAMLCFMVCFGGHPLVMLSYLCFTICLDAFIFSVSVCVVCVVL